jgi:hypothetical protein
MFERLERDRNERERERKGERGEYHHICLHPNDVHKCTGCSVCGMFPAYMGMWQLEE